MIIYKNKCFWNNPGKLFTLRESRRGLVVPGQLEFRWGLTNGIRGGRCHTLRYSSIDRIINPTSERLEIQIGRYQSISCSVSPFSCHWFVILWSNEKKSSLRTPHLNIFQEDPGVWWNQRQWQQQNKHDKQDFNGGYQHSDYTFHFTWIYLSSMFPTFLQRLITRFPWQSRKTNEK